LESAVIFLAIIAFFGYGILFPVSPFLLPTNFSASGHRYHALNYFPTFQKRRLIFGDEASGAFAATTVPTGDLAQMLLTRDSPFSKGLLILPGQAVSPQEPTGCIAATQVASSFEITLNSELGVFLPESRAPTTRKT